MIRQPLALLMTVAGLVLAAGCVERTMMIRSEPPGAPVWVDEQYAGTTPLEYSFAHYGTRGLRVGPIRDEKDKARYAAQDQLVKVEAPWYETFPIDIVAEVLWPGRIEDRHEVPVFELQSPAAAPESYGDESTQELLDAAGKFRERALAPVPETEPAD